MYDVASSRLEFGMEPNNSSFQQEPRWYACYTRGRHEKQVAQRLRQPSVDCYCPVLPLQRQWNDRKKIVEWPLFPSYVFVRCPPRALSQVVSTPGMVAVVSSNGVPISIDADEIENIRRFVAALAASGERAEPVSGVEKGTRVRIFSGPFIGVEGVVVERRGRDRVLVGLEAVAQSWEVEIPVASMHRIPPTAASGPVRATTTA